METYDYIVIGAGYAGLTATKNLLEAGKTVKLLEARDRIGGRVFTKTLEDGTYIDLGGQWIGPTQERIYALAKEYDVDTFKSYDLGLSTLLFDDKLKRYKGIIPPLPIPALLSLDFAIKKLNKLSKNINLAQPWQSPNAEDYDSMTLHTWVQGQISSQKAKMLFNIASDVIFAAPSNEVSLLHALFYTKSGGDFDRLMNMKNGAQEERLMGGAAAIAQKMIANFPIDVLRLESVVTNIVQTNHGVAVSGKDFNYSASRVIVAIPPTLAGRIAYEPALPANRDQLTQRIPMGSVWKCYAIYDRPFWRDTNLNGLAATNQGLVSVSFDNSPRDGSKGILTGFAVGNAAKKMNELSEEQRKKETLTFFEKCFGPAAATPQQYIDYSLSNEAHSRGCYAGVMPTGAWTSLGQHLSKPCGRIHWAGTETSDVWNGYIDGAVRSGERVAAEVLEFVRHTPITVESYGHTPTMTMMMTITMMMTTTKYHFITKNIIQSKIDD